MKALNKYSDPEVGFQLAPMIDVVFLILCLIAASQMFMRWEQEIDIKLPTADTGNAMERLSHEVIVNVRADGSFVVNMHELDDEGLTTLLGRIVDLFPGQPVLIRGDMKAEYRHIVRVMDICRKVDIWNISFATAVKKNEAPGK